MTAHLSSEKIGKENLANFDFSKIMLDNRISYRGYIGNNYQRLYIQLTEIQKTSDTKYSITGYSIVSSNRCDFLGTITIDELHELKEMYFGADDCMKGKIKKEGFVIASFSLAENQEQKGSGLFQGILITRWYIDNNNKLLYDDIWNNSDDYSNNQFLGNWTSYKTKAIKKCAWGHYRIPCSGDLDWGVAEFSVNPKYLNNGWEDYNP
jgi:hypothetical protein